MAKPTTIAKLIPAKIEVACIVQGRPCYKWVEGYQIITPRGTTLYPPMRKRAATALCRKEGWDAEVVRHG